MTEAEFVTRLVERINSWTHDFSGAQACVGARFDYASYRFAYAKDGSSPGTQNRSYQTDILVYDDDGETWTPLLVIECKFGGFTTHDLLTYGKKAQAHRALHPYLRYGFVVGGVDGELPFRMVVHGEAFDFLAVLANDLDGVKPVLKEEIVASRLLWQAFKSKKLPTGAFLLHRAFRILTLDDPVVA